MFPVVLKTRIYSAAGGACGLITVVKMIRLVLEKEDSGNRNALYVEETDKKVLRLLQ